MTHISDYKSFYKPDPQVEAARKLPGWKDFHRVCGKFRLFFDNITTKSAVTFTCDDRFRSTAVAKGKGATPVAAVLDAWRNSEKWAGIEEIQHAADVLMGKPVVEIDDFEALL